MSMDKCPGHYKVHVHGRDGPGCPVHGHCPVPLPALPTKYYAVNFHKSYETVNLRKLSHQKIS